VREFILSRGEKTEKDVATLISLDLFMHCSSRIFVNPLLYLNVPFDVCFTQPVTEMSTGEIKQMFLGSKVWVVSGADNFTTIYEPTV
jgi:hypothetical protein